MANKQDPYSLSELKQQVTSQQFQANYLVWKQGMAGWEKASDVAELKALFAAMPPPLPKM